MKIERASTYYVTIEDHALKDLLLPVLECCVRPPVTDEDSDAPRARRWEGNEVDGLLYGYVKGDESSQDVVIQKAAPLMTSLRKEGLVESDPAAELAQETAATLLWPQMDLLGNFHSHPYMHLRQRELDLSCFDFSPTDKEMMRETGHKLYIVVTVCRKNNKEDFINPGYTLSDRFDMSVIDFQMSDLHVHIKANIRERGTNGALRSAHRKKVVIRCPFLLGVADDPLSLGAWGSDEERFGDLTPHPRVR